MKRKRHTRHYPGTEGGLELGGRVAGGSVQAKDLEGRGARVQYPPRLSLAAPTQRRDACRAEGRAETRRRRRQCPRAEREDGAAADIIALF